MASRLKFIVAYDGRPFAGWQSQANGNAVQDHLERAFAIVTKGPVRVHGAGRTDAGVHALGQCAHVVLPARTLQTAQWVAALNTNLPPTIRVLRCSYAGATFHARFSARGKVYRYRIWNDAILPPLEFGRAWHVPLPLDLAALRREATSLVGTHDFSGFAANRGHRVDDTTRTLRAVTVRRRGKCLLLECSGDGFLYKMVRLIAGALVRCGLGKDSAGAIALRLRNPAATAPGARLVAPAEGLFLVRVRY
ncbi:MAG: tRNA pseudouridine(38-40) synthase TruA [Chthoniobacterales bacterium]